ncbi:MAG: hypothetical protein EON88_12985 [Brevundimonas sp.]|nr:MAG: hypothetical protein EON88_12985 [Brevundimonas sp.]
MMLPLTPPLATVLLLMTPPPVREVAMTMAPPLTTGPALTVATTAPVEAAALTLDTGWIALAVLAMAGALVLTRLTLLAHRARRLSALLRTGGTADADTLGLVQDAARHLAIRPPVVMMSAATAEPLLAGLRPARLVLPQDLPATDTVRRAVILHELAHLKRGDHRVLWLEEAVLALLAANPLMPLLRARRAAAREEACDAVALAGAGTETRRAYAQSLIEALRTRAGSQTAGALPALTFTGAGRTTAMHRLKAVLSPAAPANRRARMAALMTGGALLAAVAAGTVAVAAQREPVLRMSETREEAANRVMINGETVALDFSALPPFGLQAESITRSAPGVRPAWTDFRTTPAPDAPPLSIEGVKLPAGVTTDIVVATDISRIERSSAGLNIVLKRDGAQQQPPEPRPLTPERQARYRGLSAQGYREVCGSSDPGDNGFCAGVMFAQMGKAGVCAPSEMTENKANNGPALATYVEQGRQAMRRLEPRADEGAHGYAERAMQQAYPCQAQRTDNSAVVVWMPVTIEGRATLNPGDRMRVTLTDPSGALLAESVTLGEGEVRIPLTEAEFPRLGQGNRAYTLNGAIHRADGSVEPVRETTTLRLGAGSQLSARNLTATLNF